VSDPQWISREDVEFIHESVIEVGGGAQGLRDAGLLESALGRPQNQYAYGEEDIFQLAAGYAEAISRNHPFVDGNKRTAFQTAHQFLKDNGQQLQQAQGTEHVDMMERLGQGQISREDMGRYLAEHSREITQEKSREDHMREFLERSRQDEESQDQERSLDQDDDPEI